MNIEEKAKAYDEAIERAKGYHTPETHANLRIAMENLFPELKESEDERVRNKLIEFFKCYSPDEEWWGNITQEDILTWLEKQSELSNKMKIQQDDIQATDEELILFYRWLNDHELQCQRDEDAGSAELFASIKSMFIEVFGKWITKKN